MSDKKIKVINLWQYQIVYCFHCKPDPKTQLKSLLDCEACLERQVLESLQMSDEINPEH